jgi:hypothetical protein
MMPEDTFGPLEDAFFAAGDAYAQQKESSGGCSHDENDQTGFGDDDHVVVSENGLRLRLSVMRARLRPTLESARTRVYLQARLLQLRVLVALATYAELALALRVVASPVRVRAIAVQAFIPQLATRNPVLARFSLFILVFTAATFPAAAVLAATGVL